MMTRKEIIEFEYLKSKYLYDKDHFFEDEKSRYNELYDKYIQECEEQVKRNKRAEEENHKREVFKYIKPLCKFKSTLVKTGQSRQTGEKFQFYDIEIKDFPIPTKIYDRYINNQIAKWNKLRGRSHWLSSYACYRIDLYNDQYICNYWLPAIEEAYEDYLKENFYGKKEYEYGLMYKKYQIDWFDEVFVYDQKIPTSFQKRIEEIKKSYNKFIPWEGGEPQDWERAWLDSIEFETRQHWYNFCYDLKNNPEEYPLIKDYKEYLTEAGKIMHKKFI